LIIIRILLIIGLDIFKDYFPKLSMEFSIKTIDERVEKHHEEIGKIYDEAKEKGRVPNKKECDEIFYILFPEMKDESHPLDSDGLDITSFTKKVTYYESLLNAGLDYGGRKIAEMKGEVYVPKKHKKECWKKFSQ
jgi:hypothetical protein